MKAIRVGNIISYVVNGFSIFIGLIGYLAGGANDTASGFLIYGLFFIICNYLIYRRAYKGDNTKKKFQKTIAIIEIITIFNAITGIIYLVTLNIDYSRVSAEPRASNIYSNGYKDHEAPTSMSARSNVNASNTNTPVINNLTNSIKNSISNFSSGNFYDEDALIMDIYKDLETPKYILHQLKQAKLEKQNTSSSGFYIRYSGDIVEDSLKYKNTYKNNADYYPFKTYYTTFNDMNEHQLKWYLYWRKEFLSGNIIETDLSYIYLFSYELINYTFSDNAAFNVSVLHRLYYAYKEHYPKTYLEKWLFDMLCELDAQHLYQEKAEFRKSRLYSAMENNNTEYEKIGINIWRNHYSESKTSLSNKKLKYLRQNSKFYARFKKYSGKTIKYYKEKKYDIMTLWFEKKSMRERRILYSSAIVSFDRKEANLKYYIDIPTQKFYSDMTDITNLCYDNLINNEFKFDDYSVNLPNELINSFDKRKNSKKVTVSEITAATPVDSNRINVKINLDSIDTQINDIIVQQDENLIKIEVNHYEFFDMFSTGQADKITVKKYAMSNKKLDKMLIADINKFYYPIIEQNIIEECDTLYKLAVAYDSLSLEEKA